MLDSRCRCALALMLLSWLTRFAGAAGQSPDPLAQPDPPAVPQSAADTGPFELEYKFQPGEVLRWEVVHRAPIDTTIQGTNQTAETRSTSIKAWKVTDITSDGEITFVHSVESIDMWQKMQGRQEVRYNSRTDEKVPQGYEDVAKAVGVPLTEVKIDRRGKLISRTEKQPHAVSDNAPIAMPLPAEPVAIGHAWSVPVDMEVRLQGGGAKKIATRQQYTLVKVVDGLATIEVDMQVLAPLNDPAIEAQLVQRLTKGWLKFDIEAGRVVSQQQDMDRRVIGFSGAASSMHCLMRLTEEIVPASAQVAQAPKKISPPPAPSPASSKTPAPDKKKPVVQKQAAAPRPQQPARR